MVYALLAGDASDADLCCACDSANDYVPNPDADGGLATTWTGCAKKSCVRGGARVLLRF